MAVSIAKQIRIEKIERSLHGVLQNNPDKYLSYDGPHGTVDNQNRYNPGAPKGTNLMVPGVGLVNALAPVGYKWGENGNPPPARGSAKYDAIVAAGGDIPLQEYGWIKDPDATNQSRAMQKTAHELASKMQVAGRRKLKADAHEAAKAKVEKKKKKKGRGRGRKKDKIKEPTGVNFDEQAFLWDYYHLLPNLSTYSGGHIGSVEKDRFGGSALKAAGLAYKYKNFLQLTSNDPSTTNNKLWGHGADAINELTTAQLSSLVPYIRLYKVIRGDDGKPANVDFPFNKFTTVASILESKEGRGTDVGLINVTWEDTGGQPAKAGLSFRGSMRLHFQSLEGIFKERTVGQHKIAFGDLLEKKSALGGKDINNKAESDTEKVQPPCPDVVESINMTIGWSLSEDTDIWGLATNKEEVRDAVESMRRTYKLSISTQEINVTDNGDIELTIEFFANIAGRSLSTMADLLQIDENNLNPNDNPINAKLEVAFENRKLAKKAKEDNLSAIAQATGDMKKEAEGLEGRTAGKGKKWKEAKNIKEKEEKRSKDLAEEYQTADALIAELAYGRLLLNLKQGIQKNGESRVKWIGLHKDMISQYKELLKIGAQSYKESKKATKEALKEVRDEYKSDRKTYEKDMFFSWKEAGAGFMATGAPNSIKFGDTPSAAGAFGSAEGNALAQWPKDKKTGKRKKLTKEEFNKLSSTIPQPGKYERINFIYLGDIIEAAMEILYNPRNLGAAELKGKAAGHCIGAYEGLRILLGPFEFPNPMSGEPITLDMADIPISLNLFMAWWYNNTARRKKKNYMLRTFLYDLCNTLIPHACSPDRFGGLPGKKYNFHTTAFALPSNHPLNRAWKGNQDKAKERFDINTLMPGGRDGKTKGTQKDFSDWLYVYAQGGNPERSKFLRGYLEKDKEINIPHFFIGSDKGTIKSIKFSKTKLPLLAEIMIARAIQSQEGSKKVKGNLIYTARYDATVNLFGNTTFKPGMFLYIDPRSMGVGLGSSYQNRTENDLGIGGYYTVYKVRHRFAADEYTTELQTRQEFGIRLIREQRIKDKGINKVG